MSTFLKKQLKKVLPCMLVMIITCCFFVINASAETIILTEEKKLFGSPDVITASLARSVDVDSLSDYLREELIKCPESLDISSFNLEYNDANVTILSNIIYYESPELFHIKKYSMSVSGGMLIRITPTYEYSAQEYAKMYNDCMKQASIILDGIIGNSKLNDVQKALLIHDRLAVHCEYDVSNYNNNSIPSESYTMYGTLAKGVSVCQGYAETYMYLLEKIGIESRLCSSDALFHAWNIVTINGEEYHVDVTWDDPTMDKTGHVLHTNFLRSSNGIYATGHNASDYDRSPTDTTYDNYFWQCSDTAFQYVGNEIYYIDNDNGAVKKYSNQSTVVDCTDTWPASTDGNYWVGNFSSLGSDGTNLYYNLSKDVYKYTVSTGESEKIWSPDLSAGTLFRIYGFMYKDGYLICDINDTPNFELNDKQKYQQRYLYQDQSASTLQSISISSLPNQTEYYIGDSLKIDGLQLKLNYSNGASEFITSEFTVSGFSSSSGGSKTVTVSYEGFTTSFNVNVRTPGIVLDASSVKIDLKDFCRLTATTDPKNVSVKWATSNKNIATVSDGEIAAVAVGTATVTAEFIYNGYTYKASCNVTVECKHSSVITIKGKSATCTENGLTEGKKCSVCGTVTVAQKEIAKTGHKEATREENRTEASCKNNGSYNLVTYCSVCKAVIKTETKTIPATGNHIYATEVNRVASTCKTAGYVVMACGCGETKRETLKLDASNHEKIVVVNAVAATCTKTGLTEGKKCSVCGTVTVAQQTIAKKTHTEVTVKGKEATCTENGLTDGKKCSVCGTVTVAQREIEKKRHWIVKIPGKAPTETESGLTDGEKCWVCETITKEQQIIPELNHKHDYTSIMTVPNCTEKGYTTYTCRCGDTYKDDYVDALGHKSEIIAGYEATCTDSGLTDGEKCNVCGAILVEQEEITAKGHTEEIIPGKAATCTENGLTDGKKCSVCGEILKYQDEIAVKAHSYGEWIIEKPATTENEGLKVKICVDCGVKQSEIIPQLPETPDDPAEPDVMFADANGDNKITAADARIILRMAAKLDPSSDAEIAYLDINGDKKITAADARIVLRISAKLDSIDNYI